MVRPKRISTLAFLLAGVTLSSALYAAKPEGTLNVTVVNEQGVVVQDAPVYIYGEHRTHFIGGKNIPGTVTISMTPGDYRISSAVVRKSGGYINRFASHEAHVNVVEGDNASVILTLTSIDGPAYAATYAEVHALNVPTRDF